MSNTVSKKQAKEIIDSLHLSPLAKKSARKALDDASSQKLQEVQQEVDYLNSHTKGIREQLELMRKNNEKQQVTPVENPTLPQYLPNLISSTFDRVSKDTIRVLEALIGLKLSSSQASLVATLNDIVQAILKSDPKQQSAINPNRLQLLFERLEVEKGIYEEFSHTYDVHDLIENKSRLFPVFIKDNNLVSVAEAQTAIAQCEAIARSSNPTVLVTVNSGGGILGDYISNRLRIGKQRVIAARTTKKSPDVHFTANSIRINKNSRILIVDDIARTGNTLRFVYNELKSKYPQTLISCMTLVAHHTNFGQNLGEIKKYSACFTSSEQVKLPWANSGKLVHRNGMYIIGSGHKTIAITDNEAKLAYQEVNAKTKSMSE